MSFTAHKAKIIKFFENLNALAQKSPTEEHICALLEYLCANEALFDSVISANSPFYTEFFQHICADSVDPEQCFALLECLIVFCRERQLCKSAHEISAVEQNLLNFFEQSHHWHVTEHTLIHEWYWHTLPEKYGQRAMA